MKKLAEFLEWLEIEGRHTRIIVSQDDYRFLWDRVSPSARKSSSVLMINGRQIEPALSFEPLDVSNRKLFE